MKWISATFSAFLCSAALAGTFQFAEGPYEHFVVVHPAGYDGTGGAIEVKICVQPGSEISVPALRQAVALWNSFESSTQNCVGECRTVEQGAGNAQGPFSMTTVLLHELGHCALGLGHVNWVDTSAGGLGPTSYTNSKDVTSWIDGSDDTLRGTSDDRPQPLPGSRLIHWFRKADNDPIVIDSSVIDESTYSRRIVDLPTGHEWPTNGNVAVAGLLGSSNTQAVMYTAIGREQSYAGLTADEVATVQYGKTGLDEQAGTADDYSLSLKVVDDCVNANVEVFYDDFVDPLSQPLGECTVDLEYIPHGGLFEIHHALRPFNTDPRATIQINRAKLWDVVFADNFERGDTFGWSDVQP